MTHMILLSNRNPDVDGVTWLPRISTALPQTYFQQAGPNDKVLLNETKAEVSHGNF